MFLYTISGCASPLVILLIWLSITPPGESTVYSHQQLIWYFLLVMLIKTVTSAWGGQFLSARIRRGAISPFLTQPTPYIYHYISNNLAEKVVKLIILLPFLGLLSLIFNITLPPASVFVIVSFIYSLLLAAALFFIIDTVIGFLSFWLEETSAIGETYAVFVSLFSGVFIPIAALPPAVRSLSFILPFRYTISLPIEIILNQLSATAVFTSILLQTLWLILFILLYRYLWHHGLRTYSASGA